MKRTGQVCWRGLPKWLLCLALGVAVSLGLGILPAFSRYAYAEGIYQVTAWHSEGNSDTVLSGSIQSLGDTATFNTKVPSDFSAWTGNYSYDGIVVTGGSFGTGQPDEVFQISIKMSAEGFGHISRSYYTTNNSVVEFKVNVACLDYDTPVDSVTILQPTAQVSVGQTMQLSAVVSPADRYQGVWWTSSDPDVATVSEDGTVTGVKAGTTNITANAKYRSEKVQPTPCVVTVTQPVTGITIDRDQASIEVGKTCKLTATVEPSDATDKTVTWSSSNEDVAVVGEDGIVTAMKAGTATITATAGDESATCDITITAPKPPSASVTAHVQRMGTLRAASDGKVCGTTGKSLRLESLKLKLGKSVISGGIEYRTHVQRVGWETDWVRNGAMAGSEGMSRRLEAVQIRLYGQMAQTYDVWYRVHSQRYGWMAWAKNGQTAGTEGMSRRAEAIQVILTKKGAPAPAKSFQGAIQNYNRAFAKR